MRSGIKRLSLAALAAGVVAGLVGGVSSVAHADEPPLPFLHEESANLSGPCGAVPGPGQDIVTILGSPTPTPVPSAVWYNSKKNKAVLFHVEWRTADEQVWSYERHYWSNAARYLSCHNSHYTYRYYGDRRMARVEELSFTCIPDLDRCFPQPITTVGSWYAGWSHDNNPCPPWVLDWNYDPAGDVPASGGMPSVPAPNRLGDPVDIAPGGSSTPHKADIVVTGSDTNEWAVALSNGSSFGGWSGIGLTQWSHGDWSALGDVNGDGKADVVVHNPQFQRFDVAIADGTGKFGAAGTGTWISEWNAGDWAGLGDVNGDGRADLVVHNPTYNRYDVALSNGSSFVSAGGWLADWGAGDWAALGDVNGDGKADVVTHNPQFMRFDVALSNGSSFNGGGGTWLSQWAKGDFAGLADVNGS